MVDLKNERIQLRALENLFAQKRFPEALAFAEKLIGDYPNSYHIGFINVKILKELNRLREAEAAGIKLMHLSPDNINLLLELGTICLKLNKYDESYDYYNKVLFLDPFNNEARESMDKIKGLKTVSGEGTPKEKKLMDFISQPQTAGEKKKEDTAPELEDEQILNEPLEFVEEVEPVSPMEHVETVEPVESFETLEPMESFESIEQVESIDSLDFGEPVEPTQRMPITQEPSMMEFEKAPEYTEEFTEFTNEPEIAGPAEAAQITEIDEVSEMGEIPGVTDITEEVDSPETQTVDPYAAFYNEETVETAEEIVPTQTSAPGEPGEAGEAEEFVTESAADLYLTQGLYDDALRIYEKLYATRKEGRFLLKVKQLKAHRAGREKIRRLNEFLKLIQMKGV